MIFVDTSFWAALGNARDARHETAKDLWNSKPGAAQREYSFVDATSFALMRKMKLGTAFAFDGDFSAAGFVELRP